MDPAKNTYISLSLVGSLGVCYILHIPKANEHSDFSSGNILILKNHWSAPGWREPSLIINTHCLREGWRLRFPNISALSLLKNISPNQKQTKSLSHSNILPEMQKPCSKKYPLVVSYAAINYENTLWISSRWQTVLTEETKACYT